MRGKIKCLLAVFCVVAMVCGCEGMGDEGLTEETLQERRVGGRETEGQMAQDDRQSSPDIKYCAVGKLGEFKLSKEEQEDAFFAYDAEIDFSGVEAVERLYLTVQRDFLSDENIQKYADLFGGERDRFEKANVGEDGMTLRYENVNDRNYMSISENGGLVRMANLSYDMPSNTVEAKYDVIRGEALGKTVHLTDGDVKLPAFCESTEEWLGENMPVDGVRYRVTDAYIRKPKQKKGREKVISLYAAYEYKGICMNSRTSSTAVGTVFSSQRPMTSLPVMMNFEHSGVPSFFSRDRFFSIDSSEPVEEVIDFGSAVRIMKGKRAQLGSFRVEKVLPMYALFFAENRGEAEQPGTRLEARPVYAFLTANESSDVNFAQSYIFVDMVTGQVTVG